jgi:cytochrome c oxidase subunit 2
MGDEALRAQSSLEPAGEAAARIATLFYWMAGSALLIWLAMVGITLYALRARADAPSRRQTERLIIIGGAVVPTLGLAILLLKGLALLPKLIGPAPAHSLRIAVTGEQWWWRIRYTAPGGATVELANEIHLPLGETTEFQLDSADVIHSFWIPPLGGKIDMFPGRTTRIALRPTRSGIFRGVCAEYCGTSHALMSFSAIVEERAHFERWLAHQAEPAQAPAQPLAARGQALFLSSGCGACHTVRGTAAAGVVGPDLTHVGSRRTIGGDLPNDADGFLRFISHPQVVKPGALMPAFSMLPQEDLRAIAAYLEALE